MSSPNNPTRKTRGFLNILSRTKKKVSKLLKSRRKSRRNSNSNSNNARRPTNEPHNKPTKKRVFGGIYMKPPRMYLPPKSNSRPSTNKGNTPISKESKNSNNNLVMTMFNKIGRSIQPPKIRKSVPGVSPNNTNDNRTGITDDNGLPAPESNEEYFGFGPEEYNKPKSTSVRTNSRKSTSIKSRNSTSRNANNTPIVAINGNTTEHTYKQYKFILPSKLPDGISKVTMDNIDGLITVEHIEGNKSEIIKVTDIINAVPNETPPLNQSGKPRKVNAHRLYIATINFPHDIDAYYSNMRHTMIQLSIVNSAIKTLIDKYLKRASKN